MLAAAKSMAASLVGSPWGEYIIEASHCASGGPRFLLRVFRATHKKSGSPVSVFVLDKNDSRIASMPKTQREAFLESFRRDISTLRAYSQAKPAPNLYVLRLYEVFEETKKSIAFVAERVVFSLGNILRDFENLPPERIREVRPLRFHALRERQGGLVSRKHPK